MRVEEDSNHTTSQIIVDTSANTVYNNTLRVRGRENGTYKCTVHQNFLTNSDLDRTASLVIQGESHSCSIASTFT